MELDAITAADYRDGLGSGDWSPDFTRVSHLRRRNEWHWVEPSADGRVIHVGYNVTLGDVSGFAREVEALAASARVGLVILDLRLNGGGDNRTYQPLLRSMERLGDTTRLAVLTSRTSHQSLSSSSQTTHLHHPPTNTPCRRRPERARRDDCSDDRWPVRRPSHVRARHPSCTRVQGVLRR